MTSVKARVHAFSYTREANPESPKEINRTQSNRDDAASTSVVLTSSATVSEANSAGSLSRKRSTTKTSAAIVRLTPAATKTVVLMPRVGMRTKPPAAQPITAPRVLVAYRSPTRLPNCAKLRTKKRLNTGNVAPIKRVGNTSRVKDSRKSTMLKRKG